MPIFQQITDTRPFCYVLLTTGDNIHSKQIIIIILYTIYQDINKKNAITRMIQTQCQRSCCGIFQHICDTRV